MKHILVIRLSALGDVALMAPLVRDYACSNPDIRFTVAGPPLLQPLFSGMDNVEYLGLKKKQSFIKIYRILHAVGADTVVDLHKVNRVGFALTLLRLRHLFDLHFRLCALRKGKFTRWLYLHHWYHKPRKPQYQRYDEVFQRAGLKRQQGKCVNALMRNLDCVNASMRNCVSADASASDAITQSHNNTITPAITQSHNNAIPNIGIAPFSQHKGKIWPWESVCRLIEMLAAAGYRVLLFGSKEEAPQLETLKSERVESLAGKQSFAEELEIIKGLSLMVSMDSSNMHFASALGVPVVSIWGATHPDFGFYPPQQPRANALCANLPCQPCSAFGSKPCRYGDYRCLTAITPDMVFDRINSFSAEHPHGGQA